MNYNHYYHAGHSTDVFKHIVVLEILAYLLQKDKPISYLETHAGYAFYDLMAPQAKGFEEGIAKLWNQPNPLWAQYLKLVQTLNPDGKLRYYPGSAQFAAMSLRAGDKMYLADVNADAAKNLQTHLRFSKHQIAVGDGYQLAKAWLPPTPRRGFMMIDPPFEQADEWKVMLQTLREIQQRWPTGVIAIWYPIKSKTEVDQFLKNFHKLGIEKSVNLQFCPKATDVDMRLNGSGMLIINPPFQLAEKIHLICQALLKSL